MIKRKWSEWSERLAPPGSPSEPLVNKIKEAGSITAKEVTAWYKTTPAIPEGFTDHQTSVALGSQLDILERFGAIEISKSGLIVWVGD